MKIKLEVEFDVPTTIQSEAIAMIEDQFRMYASNEHTKHAENLMVKATEFTDIADLLEIKSRYHKEWAKRISNANFNYIMIQ